MSVTEVHGALGLDKLKNRTFQIFKVIQIDILYSSPFQNIDQIIVDNNKIVYQASATKGEGLDESMEWLSNTLQNKKQMFAEDTANKLG